MLERLKWFEEARYGLFIHWGLYAELGGIWNGKSYPPGTEWIMRRAQIPFEEYKKLADTFTAEDFDAEKLVLTAKNAGCKCLSVLWGFRDKQVLLDAGARYLCENPADMAPMIEDMLYGE